MSYRYLDQNDLLNIMHADGIHITSPLINDFMIHRFPVDPKDSKKSGYYIFSKYNFTYGNFKAGLSKTVKTKQFLGDRTYASESAFEYWEKLGTEPAINEYTRSKGITAYRARKEPKGSIVIPMYDKHGSIHSLQTITNNGNKIFRTGCPAQGMSLLLDKGSDTLILCEGYATGCTLFEYSKSNVLICFSVSSVKNLVLENPGYRGSNVFIAVDNDKAGTDCLKYLRSTFIINSFLPPQAGEDWNDTFKRLGAEGIKEEMQKSYVRNKNTA